MLAFARPRLALAALVSGLAGCSAGSDWTAPAGSRPDAGLAGATGGLDADSGAGVEADARAEAGGGTDGSILANGGDATGGDSLADAGFLHLADGGDATGGDRLADAGFLDSSPSSADAGLAPYKGVANSPCNDLVALGATWYYNWELSPPCKTPQFVPMVWGHGGAEQTKAGIAGEIAGLVSKGDDIVLGFNEPDNATQSNISVATAISLWPAFNNASVRIGSPATQANTAGQTWFRTFMSDVNADKTGTLRVDFIAAHWYGWNAGSCDAKAQTLESYVNYLEGIPGNRSIWLTEWGCLNASNPNAATVQAFFSGAVAMFARHPRIERYAWYPYETYNELVTSTNALTSLGTVFAAAPAHQ
jgi:Glycosyl hydrolase catalytic core